MSSANEQQEILARGIARAKELAAKLAKNPLPKRSYDEASGYQQQMPSNASSFYSQQDAFNQYKRQAMGGEHQSYPQRSYPVPSGNTEHMMIPGAMVGLVIGRGGETLKGIQMASGVRIQIDKENIGQERRVNITGNKDAIEEARRLINEKIGGGGQQQQMSASMTAALGSYGPTEERERMVIPASKVGLVIGTRGQTLRNLQEQSGARIQVDRDHEAQNPTERQIVIFGTAETVKRAKEMLDQLLNGGSVAALRGPGQQMQQPQMLINVPGDLVGLLIGRGGDTIKNIQQMCGCNVKIDQNNGAAVRVVTVTGPQENWAYAEELIQEKVQGAGEVQSSSSAAASAYPAAATAGYAYYDANGGSTSAQAYADYYAQYYQQQQASAASGSATGANAGAEGEDKKEGEASNANSADYAAYYQQYYQAYASAMGGDPNADYAAYYQQYYNAANSDKKEDGDKDNKEDADKKKDKEDNKEAEDK